MPTRSPLSRIPGRLPLAAVRWRPLLTLCFCLVLALAPNLAEARAGRSFSSGGHSGFSGMGSRGTRTFEHNGGAPINRTMNATPRTAPGMPGMAPGYGGSFFQRHPFLSGMAGGFLGSMLFGHMGGLGHVFGGLLTVLIIGFIIFFVVRLFARGGASWAGGAMPRSVGAAAAPSESVYRGSDTTVVDSDLNAFQAIHAGVQDAWSRGDLAALRPLMTPEMLSYFSEELTRNASQGVRNVVSDVRLLKGDVTESWEEGDLQYATAYLRWSAIDYVVPVDGSAGQPGATAQPGALVAGDVRTPTEAEEVWTFVRSPGGHWLLSAIQQV